MGIQLVKHRLVTSYGSSAGSPGGVISHGDQLTINHVGPWTVQGVAKGGEQLVALNTTQLAERVSTYPGNGRPSWIPGTDFVLNGDPSNHGGVVPAGGMVIDGWLVPAGTWVAQFYDMSANNVIVEGDAGGAGSSWPGVMFRGCRARNNWTSPGFINYNAIANNGKTWLNYCDLGGLDVVPANICESIIESQGTGANDRQFLIRNYLSVATTLAFGRNNGDGFIENYGDIVPRYFNNDTYHLNGLSNSGGQTATLWLRNHLDFSPQADGPSANPWFKSQNDCIQMAADGGAYPGTGTNLDGSQGYQMRDNWLAGADHQFQFGVDKSNTAADVSHVVVTGNKCSTFYFPNGGETAVGYKSPPWGSQGNVFDSTNIWADDFGTGSWDYTTHNAARQYPSGNGPRAGTALSQPGV